MPEADAVVEGGVFVAELGQFRPGDGAVEAGDVAFADQDRLAAGAPRCAKGYILDLYAPGHSASLHWRSRPFVLELLRWLARLGQMRFADPKSDFIEKIEAVFGGVAHHEPFYAAACYFEEYAVGGKEFPLDDF